MAQRLGDRAPVHAGPSLLPRCAPPCHRALQTGSGKTHTMLGRLDDGDLTGPDSPAALPEGAGLIPRTFAYLFRRISELEGPLRQGREVSFAVSVALVEIYKEQVRGSGRAAGEAAKDAGVRPRATRGHPDGLCKRSLAKLGHLGGPSQRVLRPGHSRRSQTCWARQAASECSCGRTSRRESSSRAWAGTR